MKRAKMLVILGLVLALGLATQVANGDFTFGTAMPLPDPINVPGINSADLTMTADGLEVYFMSINRPGGYGGEDIWCCRRESVDDDWGPATNLGPKVNTSACESQPSISADVLQLYFSDTSPLGTPNRPGGFGGGDIWVARRPSRTDAWGVPTNLGSRINTSAMEVYPDISYDGLSLYYSTGDLWVTTRPTKDDDWGAPVRLSGALNSGSWEGFPNISPDERALLFYSDSPGGYGGMDIYISRRSALSDPWAPPVNLGPSINTPFYDIAPSFSPDGSVLYFCRGDSASWGGRFHICQAAIEPIVDFNGDAIVNTKDFSKLAQYWGQDESSVDIGPNPWGDGTVDIQDMAVLAAYWLKEVLPTDLIAYWKFDEREGTIAHDSVGDNDGTLNGNPLWQPGGGKIGGALQLDGVDDCVSTPFILDPGSPPDGGFSVFAWVKGGGPGQVIMSQTAGANWLLVDPAEGKFMTNLAAPAGRFPPKPLPSESVITDGQWHRVGLTWDGTNRTLYVDDVEVAKDNSLAWQAHKAGYISVLARALSLTVSGPA